MNQSKFIRNSKRWWQGCVWSYFWAWTRKLLTRWSMKSRNLPLNTGMVEACISSWDKFLSITQGFVEPSQLTASKLIANQLLSVISSQSNFMTVISSRSEGLGMVAFGIVKYFYDRLSANRRHLVCGQLSWTRVLSGSSERFYAIVNTLAMSNVFNLVKWNDQ